MCGAGDCRPVTWERAACAALAVSNDDPTSWGSWGGAPSIEEADDLAVEQCENVSGGRCSIATEGRRWERGGTGYGLRAPGCG